MGKIDHAASWKVPISRWRFDQCAGVLAALNHLLFGDNLVFVGVQHEGDFAEHFFGVLVWRSIFGAIFDFHRWKAKIGIFVIDVEVDSFDWFKAKID